MPVAVCLGGCLALQLLACPPLLAQGNAPLDTLASPDAAAPWQPRNLNHSRKILPDVKATTLPESVAPTRPPRLDDPLGGAFEFHLAQQAGASGNLDLAAAKLRAACSADPGQPRYQLWHALQSLRQLKPMAFVGTLPAALRSALAQPLDLARLLLLGHQGAILYLALLWSLLAAAYLMRSWMHLGHDFAALFWRDTRHRPRVLAVLLLPLLLVMIRAGWLGTLAILSVPLCLRARGKALVPLLTVWVAVTLLLFPNWPAIRQAVPAIDPGSETNLLWRAGHLPASTKIIRALDRRLAAEAGPARRSRLQLALGLQHARQGNYDLSSALFQGVLDHDPGHVAARVGLANNTYYQGHFDQAVPLYIQAAKHAPQVGEIPYNMAQVYFKKLFVPEGDEALRTARSLGFDPPAWEDEQGQANGFTPVVYLGPSREEITISSAAEAGHYEPLIQLEAWRAWLGAPPLPFFALSLGLLVLTLMILIWRSHHHCPDRCTNCARPICSRCWLVHKETCYCHVCGETAERAKSEMVLMTLLKNRSRSEGLALAQRVSLYGRLLPGAGHIAADRLLAGVLRLALLAAACFLPLFSWSFEVTSRWTLPGMLLPSETIHPLWFPLPAAAWPGWTSWPIIAGAALLVSLYLMALADSNQLRHQIPKQLQGMSADTPSPARTAVRTT